MRILLYYVQNCCFIVTVFNPGIVIFVTKKLKLLVFKYFHVAYDLAEFPGLEIY